MAVGYEWKCSDGTSSSWSAERTVDCDPNTQNGTGGAGVNQGDPENGDTTECTEPNMVWNASANQCECISGFVPSAEGGCVNPCDSIKAHLNEDEVKERMEILKRSTDDSIETGYLQMADGSFRKMDIANDGHSVGFKGRLAGSLGYMHTHTKPYQDSEGNWHYPKPIFSPKDITSFLFLVKNVPDVSVPKTYATLVAPNKFVYTLRFTGDQSQINYGLYDLDDLNDKYYKMIEKAENISSFEDVFLEFIKKHINIEGINLFRVNSDGSTTLIKKDNNGERDTEPC